MLKQLIPSALGVSILSLLLIILASSCTSSKKMNYFNDLPDTKVNEIAKIGKAERVIEPGDLLDITFSAVDPEAARPFNKQQGSTQPQQSGSSSSTSGSSAGAGGYVVDLDSLVEIPVIGKKKVAGLTASALKAELVKWVRPYMKDPLVEVKFNNFRITVLGEVRSPGTYNIPMQRTTIFEALAAAGDLPNSAKRRNVQIYRNYNGQRSISKFDLTKNSFLTDSTVFEMQPNDVVYIQTRPGSRFREDFGFFSTILTMVVTIVTLGITVSK